MFSKRLRMNQYTVALSTFPTFLGNVREKILQQPKVFAKCLARCLVGFRDPK